MTDKQPAAEKTVTVTLKRAHRHAGIDYPPGARIDVHPDLIEWLTRQGVIEPPAKQEA